VVAKHRWSAFCKPWTWPLFWDLNHGTLSLSLITSPIKVCGISSRAVKGKESVTDFEIQQTNGSYGWDVGVASPLCSYAVSEILPGRREAWTNHWQTKQRTVDETNNACIAFTAVSLTHDWLRGSPRFDSRYEQLFFIMFRPEPVLTQPPVHWVRGVFYLIGKLSSFVWDDGSQRVGH